MDRLGGPRPLLRPKVLSFCHSLAWIREAVATGQALEKGIVQGKILLWPNLVFVQWPGKKLLYTLPWVSVTKQIIAKHDNFL